MEGVEGGRIEGAEVVGDRRSRCRHNIRGR
jgi:hypothetical protein